ncbi:MAG: hypothetical protein AB1758_05765 [Candidatus Eremiobacterota bacterium]
MHFEILVEDRSGQKALDLLMPKLIGGEHTFRTHAYKGIGHIPKKLKKRSDVSKRILLGELPRLLRGYGKAFASYPENYPAVVFLICDLDDKCLKTFRDELLKILAACTPAPPARFCFAVEEGEAWLLGDLAAVKTAYPGADDTVLSSYVNDSICGTWELLADAVYPGGAKELGALGFQVIGQEKSRWAEAICPHIDVQRNASPSFCYFRNKVQECLGSQ